DVLLLNFWGVTLTLPGVAGIILSVGMAVDANIIIFERLKEELRAGKSARSAVNAGFARALPAILDGNITTFIASTVLFFMGTGALKGFAQTLMIGIGVSMFTAIVITRFALRCLLGMGIKNPKFYGVKAMKGGEA
ncbi:MAG: MMPL family transporter, partial [Anaerotignaceae bacterium]